ncbi:hypothetical protein JA1_004606 [Spathaspora sp. JA1]|nr:hypothetical protein JA1_004606 [Spathaspora sp. JA1]
MSSRQRSSSVNSMTSNHSMSNSPVSSIIPLNLALPLPPPPPRPPILVSQQQQVSHVGGGGGSTVSTPTTMHSPIFPPHTIPGHIPTVPTPNTARSMSIVSLESPRNSIISFDEVMRPTRNNSSTSLASLTSQTAPPTVTGATTTTSANINPEYTMSKRIKSGVLLSDEELESDSTTTTHTPTRSIIRPIFKLRRKNSRETNSDHHNNQFLQLKRDFKLKFDELISTTNTTTISSPTSILPTSPSSALLPIQQLNASPLDVNPIQLDSSALETSTSSKKKIKPNTLIQQSMLIKRKLAISKDLQLELLNSIAPGSTTTTTLSHDLLDSKLSKTQQPIMQALSDQNELIKKLNRRWNKSIVNHNTSSSISTNATTKKEAANSRKRSRRISFDDEGGSSSSTTPATAAIGGYESYDDYYDLYDD